MRRGDNGKQEEIKSSDNIGQTVDCTWQPIWVHTQAVYNGSIVELRIRVALVYLYEAMGSSPGKGKGVFLRASNLFAN